ncbi:MAG: VOC family protein [Acidobacteria bacterium]|nr:VOC family protein [Acidobacteriota bacterium]
MKLQDVTPNLIVTDIDRSTAFYRDVLDFAIVATVPDAAPFVFVWLQRDGVSVFLNLMAAAAEDLPQFAARSVGGTNALFITLEAESPESGIDALFQQIEGRTKVVMPLKTQFYGMREFGVEDPDGYVILFAQRVA